MARKGIRPICVTINRVPVLAEVLCFEHDEALTLGRAVAGLNACFLDPRTWSTRLTFAQGFSKLQEMSR